MKSAHEKFHPRAHASSAFTRKDPIAGVLAVRMGPEARLEGLSHCESPGSGSRPRHAPLQTGHRPVCFTLRALTRVRRLQERNPIAGVLTVRMVPEARLELARCRHRWILSPLRLPIPPLGRTLWCVSNYTILKEAQRVRANFFPCAEH